MNKNILIVLGGAVLVAVLVAMLVQVTLGGKGKPSAPEDYIQVLVASADLGIGREIKPGDTRWQDWPKASAFPGAVMREGEQKPEEALSGRLARDVAKGEPVMRSALLAKTKGNMVAANLDQGMRAVAIEVSASTMVGGFIGPGDFVDVILTYKASINSNDENPRIQKMLELNLDKMATETILQNVKVLAIDQTAERPAEEKIKVGKTVTLAVKPQDAERLSLAAGMGELTLALRGLGDEILVEKKWQTISDQRLTNVTDEIYAEYEKIKKEDGANSNIVRIYNGEQVTALPAR